MANFKIVIRTLMAVFVLAFCATTFHYYVEQGNARAETLEPKLPDFEHTNNQQFLDNVIQCVNYIEHNTTDVYPVNLELLHAQAALESGWGNSRFARVGKNLFGIRTWNIDDPHLLPIPWTKWPGWGVKVYETRCDSVRDYLRILNEVFAFTEFRAARDSGVDDGLVLAEYLTQYASNQNYVELVKEVIKYNIRGEYDI